MKNNLLELKSFKSCNIDRLPNHNDFLELLITNKIEEGELSGVADEITEVFERAFGGSLDDDDDDYCEFAEDTNPLACERLKFDIKMETSLERDSDNFLYAGYTDCMEEAIRFLVEEENISPEHPIVENLKAHLEKSKDRILQSCSFLEDMDIVEREVCKMFASADNLTSESYPLNSFTFGNVQSCRNSG